MFWKTIHIISVVLFLGNIITGIFWKAQADATRNPTVQAHALAGVIRSDRYFTLPSVIMIVVSGVALALIGGFPILRTPWIATSIVAFGISGLLFGIFVVPLQRRLLQAARSAETGAEWPSSDYKSMSRRWELAGALAILLPLAALALMVFKPELRF